MRAVMDTNVLVAAFRSRSGASYELLRLLREGKWTLVLSNTVLGCLRVPGDVGPQDDKGNIGEVAVAKGLSETLAPVGQLPLERRELLPGELGFDVLD